MRTRPRSMCLPGGWGPVRAPARRPRTEASGGWGRKRVRGYGGVGVGMYAGVAECPVAQASLPADFPRAHTRIHARPARPAPHAPQNQNDFAHPLRRSSRVPERRHQSHDRAWPTLQRTPELPQIRPALVRRFAVARVRGETHPVAGRAAQGYHISSLSDHLDIRYTC